MANEKRLVDANVFIRDLTAMKSAYDAIALDGMIKALNEAPTVDAVEVVHGRWIKGSNVGCGVYFRCSACGVYQFLYGYLSEDAPTGYKYCPNCGAKMDLEV